jgi:hypothetical protein
MYFLIFLQTNLDKCELAYNLQPFETLKSFGIMNGGRY